MILFLTSALPSSADTRDKLFYQHKNDYNRVIYLATLLHIQDIFFWYLYLLTRYCKDYTIIISNFLQLFYFYSNL